jgi:hypothetical protein
LRLTAEGHSERVGKAKARLRRKEKVLMKLFLASLIAACALMAAMATSAVASTDSNFPEGVSNPGTANACTVLSTSPASLTGSDTGFANKAALFTDACLGGP